MAIDTGVALNCAALVEVGGLNNIYVTNLSNLSAATAAGTNAYSSLAGTVPWAMFQLKPNTATWATTSSKENGVTKFETTVSWYIPNVNSTTSHILEDMKNACIVAVGEFRSGGSLTCGISEAYKGDGNGANDWIYNDTYATMSLEETSGADFADGNGVTVTLTATSFETPRVFTGSITPAVGNTTAVLA